MDVVPFFDLKRQYESVKGEQASAIGTVVAKTAFSGGEFVDRFEKEFADYCGLKHIVGVNSATAAGGKIFFRGCPPISDLRSPSGHTSLSTLIYGATALIAVVEGGAWRPRLAAAGGIALILTIAVSRLLLGAHTVIEVALGGTIGTACIVLFGCRYRRLRPKNARLAPLLVAMTVVALALRGTELRAEELLHRITGFFRIACR
jgi:membrane-associated phospholipid phosphatase